MKTFADISDCGRYRYLLTRRWGENPVRRWRRGVTFIMLNPSTADAHKDDATIRRCIGFAQRWGAEALHVVNLFAWRATDPKKLRSVEDPFGPENEEVLRRVLSRPNTTLVAAWGADPSAARAVERWGPTVFRHSRFLCLGKTASGAPRHPLYIPKDKTLEAFQL